MSKHKGVISSLLIDNIVANMPGHVYWKDRNGVYLGCNLRQAQSLGFNDAKDIIGKTDFDLPWDKQVAAHFHANDFRIMQSNTTEIFEEESQMDGRKVIVLSQKTPMHDKSGQVIGILGISIDITDRKKMEVELKEAKERAEAANLTKTQFLDNMRHDIRTPLTGIVGFATIISEEINDPNIKEYVENLKASSDALLELLNEILEIIAINAGTIPLTNRKFNLQDRLSGIIDLYQAKAHEKKIKLTAEFDESLPPYLVGDSLRIHRIILELISNAFNFTDSGCIRLHASVVQEQGQSLILKLMVTDTGIGIPADKQELIFHQFQRLTPSYKGVYKGAGLGLTIVNEFINTLKGEIYVESEFGKGSSFICLIPLKKALVADALGCEKVSFSQPKKPHLSLESTPKIVEHGNKSLSITSNILVVEDNLIAATVAKSLLQSLSCKVDSVADGKSAVTHAQQHHYDLIFMDVGLPDIDGLETTRRIRLQELTNGAHVPIIALTAHVDEENKQHCLQVGMNAVLIKPLTKEKAQDILNAFVPKLHTATLSTAKKPQAFDAPLEGAVIDYERLLAQVGRQNDIAHEMLAMLVDSFPAEHVLLQNAYDKGDWLTLKKLAHKMKSGAAYCATTRLNTACFRLESAIKKEETTYYSFLFQQLMHEMELVNSTFVAKS